MIKITVLQLQCVTVGWGGTKNCRLCYETLPSCLCLSV